ncbi:hypothetical protein ACTHPJ_13700 [Paenibacillus amylolyticus]|uniref:hypothetical protein n=1 Tax=Paenibacillus amylolyticus TaxID=1451 RepID=UPI003F8143DB
MEAKLIQELAEKLAEGLKERKLAQKRAPGYGEVKEANLLEGLDKFIDDLDKQGGIYEQYDLDLNAQEYWTAMVRAQIDIIGMSNGSGALRKVYEALEHVEGNSEYNYQSGFSSCADGLHGWYK